MATSEIEKLERRYAENPHGLTFAPLAEVHRKNGDVARALELLRVGLELHPNYIPASIVLGRCHQDLGDLPAAEGAFSHVLRLDDENVIALKSMADINERQDRLDEAEQWLRRLVSVDRSNDEARQQLRRVESLKESRVQPANPPSPAGPAVPHEVALADEVPPAKTPVVVQTAAPPPQPADLEPLELTEEVAASAPSAEAVKPPVEQVTPQRDSAGLEPAAMKPRVSVPEALADRVDGSEDHPQPSPVTEPEKAGRVDESAPVIGLVSAEFQAPVGPPSESIGLDIETEEDVVLRSSGAAEFSVPDASQDLAAFAAKLNATRPRSPGRRASDRAAPERLAPTADTPAKSKPAPPGPPQPEPAPEPIAAPLPVYSASQTQGQSIAAFFQVLLVARPPADRNTPASRLSGEGGVPTRPAQDELSLSSVFGADTPISPSAAGSGPAKDAGVSFDDFFGSSGQETSPLGPSGTEPGKDDLDQFHSWLQNLKR